MAAGPVVGDIQGNIITAGGAILKRMLVTYIPSDRLTHLGTAVEGKWIGFSHSNFVPADKMIWRLLKQAS